MATTLLIPEAKVCFGCFREDRNGPLHVEKNTLWSMTVLWIEPEATDLVSAVAEDSESKAVELHLKQARAHASSSSNLVRCTRKGQATRH